MKSFITRSNIKQIFDSRIFWVLLYLIAGVPIVLSVLKGGVFGADSAYYLMTVGKIAEGYTLYKEIAVGYTPLWFYLMYLLSYPFGISCYHPAYFLALHYLFAIGCSVLMVKIAKIFTHSRSIALLAGWLLLISSHWLDGHYVLLEIPSVFFGLLSLCLILHHGSKRLWLYIVYGVVAACAFWVKQFGLGFFMLGYILLLFETDRWKKIGLFSMGFAMTAVACFGIWGKELIPVIFSSYGTTSAVEAGLDTSFSALFARWFMMMRYLLLRIAPALLCVVLMVFIPFKVDSKRREWLLCICAIGGFSLQYRFAQAWTSIGGLHYYQYLMPFVVLLIAVCLSYETNKYLKGLLYAAVAITVVLNLHSTYNNRVRKLYLRPNFDDTHQSIAQKAKQYVEEGKTVWIPDLITLYYYGEFTPPNLKEYGYSFGTLVLNTHDVAKQIRSADYVIHRENTTNGEQRSADANTAFLKTHKSIPLGHGVVLYDMNQPHDDSNQ